VKGWILYKRHKKDLTDQDHGVNRLLSVASAFNIELEVYTPDDFLLSNGRHPFLIKDAKTQLPDFILPRLSADDSTYQALNIIKQLELRGVYSFNTSQAIATAKDKLLVSQLLAANQLPSPKTMLINFPVSLALIEKNIGFPLVIKNNSSARGIGICLFENKEQLIDFMGFFEKNSPLLIAQEFIKESYGRDLRVFIVGSQVIGCMERQAKSGFKANYSLGGQVLPFEITSEIASLALNCAKLCGLEIGGIDLLFAKNHFLICEANSSPGFKGLEAALNQDIAKKIMHYISEKIINRTSLK
jgi:RimK family alpha-L-glutamate ligase